jgi:hypothetical protein
MAQVDIDARYAASVEDELDVEFKRGLLRLCESYLSVEDDPAYYVGLELIDLMRGRYANRPGPVDFN